MLAGALGNAYDVNLASAAGAAEMLENQTLRWVAEFVGYPGTGRRLHERRHDLEPDGADRRRASTRCPARAIDGVSGAPRAVYCSEESHHSVARAVEVIGLGSQALRTNPDRRAAQDARRRAGRALRADRDAGVVPVAVVATSGTTLTGAIDPLAEIADVCARARRVDARRRRLRRSGRRRRRVSRRSSAGIERADSLTIDAHKWLGVQKSCSLVMLSRQGPLERAFAHDERYMLHAGVAANGVDRTLEYSRPVRSLKLWLAFRVYGAATMRRWIEATALARPQARRHAGRQTELRAAERTEALGRLLPAPP